MNETPYGYLFIGIAVIYALQLLLTGWQAKRYFNRLKELRKQGLTSVGMAGSKWSGRVYAVLVIDPENNILCAEKMSGMTIFSTLKPIPNIVGLNAIDLAKNFSEPLKDKKLQQAIQNAAREFLKAENTEPVPEKISDVKSVRMYHRSKK